MDGVGFGESVPSMVSTIFSYRESEQVFFVKKVANGWFGLRLFVDSTNLEMQPAQFEQGDWSPCSRILLLQMMYNMVLSMRAKEATIIIFCALVTLTSVCTIYVHKY